MTSRNTFNYILQLFANNCVSISPSEWQPVSMCTAYLNSNIGCSKGMEIVIAHIK